MSQGKSMGIRDGCHGLVLVVYLLEVKIIGIVSNASTRAVLHNNDRIVSFQWLYR